MVRAFDRASLGFTAMMMKRLVWVGSLAVFVAAWAGACQGPDEYFRSSGQVGDTGGDVATGGSSTGGSATATGGARVTGSGGVIGTGGRASGGSTGTGTAGRAGTGTAGSRGTGGVLATGGTTGGAAGRTGSAGRSGSGGTTTGGAAGRTGTTGTAGRTGTTGIAGRTGAAGVRGTAGAGGAANCIDAIRQMNYAYPGAPACSMCTDNGSSLATKCESMIDCMAKSYPCTGNCETNCLNMANGTGVLQTCVDALIGASCP
jgi:hypothetical protein